MVVEEACFVTRFFLLFSGSYYLVVFYTTPLFIPWSHLSVFFQKCVYNHEDSNFCNWISDEE